ncbi:MAG: ABC transporter substrate-binding protein [Alphaproteobacteria bacterium]|nr:MAG: ABC transporter substrate-binding protein [Alphaproteobacteria bacterium]
MWKYNRILFAVFLVCLTLPLPLSAADGAALSRQEQLVQTLGNDALTELVQKEITQAQREKKMAKLLDKYFDMDRIAKLSLGKNWRTATDAQKKEYLKLFRQMVIRTYASRFGEYSGEVFEVTGYRELNKRDSLVHSKIVPEDRAPVAVDWRLRAGKDSDFLVIDVVVEGVSMMQTQRSEFESLISQNGGDFDAFLAALK